jgi:FG-GAP-like repeat
MNVALVPLVGLILVVAQADGQEYPRWTQLSSKTGDLPVPGKSKQQTGCLVLDIDKNGLNDIVITSRGAGSRVVWYQRGKAGWTTYTIDRGLDIEAGGAAADIDCDGDMDLVFGEDYTGSKLYWWENPCPVYAADRAWVRREIKSTGGAMHHDQIFGEFGENGIVQLAFWVQKSETLCLANIPRACKGTEPWRVFPIAKVGPAEGLAKADIDCDGKIDLIGGGYWFKYREGSSRYQPMLIEKGLLSTRAQAGQLVEGGPPEVVFVAGDDIGPLKWFEWRRGDWVGHDLLIEDVVHGHSLELADIDQDGHLDIFCAEMAQWTETATRPDNPSARTWIFHGDGHGRFTKTLLATGLDNHESRVADLDGDGDLDIVVKPYTRDTPRLDVWLNQGTGPKKSISTTD